MVKCRPEILKEIHTLEAKDALLTVIRVTQTNGDAPYSVRTRQKEGLYAAGQLINAIEAGERKSWYQRWKNRSILSILLKVFCEDMADLKKKEPRIPRYNPYGVQEDPLWYFRCNID